MKLNIFSPFMPSWMEPTIININTRQKVVCFFYGLQSCTIKAQYLRVLNANNCITTIYDHFQYPISLTVAMSCRIATAQTKVQSTTRQKKLLSCYYTAVCSQQVYVLEGIRSKLWMKNPLPNSRSSQNIPQRYSDIL